MAAGFLASQGIDLDAEMAKVQLGALPSSPSTAFNLRPYDRAFDILNVSLPATYPQSTWDVALDFSGHIESIAPHNPPQPNVLENDTSSQPINGRGALLAPALCHPHIHLDKAFLLSHPKHSHLQIEKGSFSEAMDLTSRAKANFDLDDLLERGMRLVDESVQAGVTSMRAFVEVDPIVGMKCIDAGKAIKDKSDLRCHIQLCVFAQLPLYSADDGGSKIRQLVRDATTSSYSADAFGSTPYVEDDRGRMEKNVEWSVDLALERDLHLDFHLDYNLDPSTEPLVWHVIETLKRKEWTKHSDKTIVLGHCTRLSLFNDQDWKRLKQEIADLPISFVGLPTSDLFMMRTDSGARGTLPVPRMIGEYGLNAAISINNIGNAFTPQGSCDPLSIACQGVGVYQAGTKRDAEILYECISTRAKTAIGLSERPAHHASSTLNLEPRQPADLLLFGRENKDWRTRRTVQEAVYLYDGCRSRMVIKGGLLVE